ncbi:uncharacterized protein OCT59_017140 [Rhizophagus irregularis]|uniref:uncharacterized protein n=1 Tax=Rhizophagus irregularis TaxID=588596 RepID=UPI0033168649|nr:hypothetical protein OCT59_017140 [Rhizophagus irregularis]
MSKYKKIRELLSFYIITAYQDMENKDLFEEEGDSNKEDDDDLVMLGLTSLLRIKYLEQRSYHVAKSKDWNHLQASVELQLAIFLRRIGSKEDIFGLCSRFGITKETIYLYCKAKQNIHEGFKNIGEMKDVIGAIDGSYIVLANKCAIKAT